MPRGMDLRAGLALALVMAPAAGARAQDDVAGGAAEPAAVAAEAAPEAPARRAPPPVLVAVLPTGRLPADVVAAVTVALTTQLGPMAVGREVHAVADEAMLASVARCTEPTCIGALLAAANAQAGVLLRLRRRGPTLAVRLEMVDPVSGAARLAPIEGTLLADAAAVAQGLSVLTEQLRPAMPSPPPPPARLLITVDVDGAAVSVDGTEIGTSPVAPIEVEEGDHEVVIMRPGYLSQRRRISIAPSQQARVDVNLEVLGGGGGGSEAGPSDGHVFAGQLETPGAGAPPEPPLIEQWWFWTIVGGAVLVVALGIGIGVGVATAGSGQPPTPAGIPVPPITGGM